MIANDKSTLKAQWNEALEHDETLKELTTAVYKEY